jgi:drug/metabolite transporter (DMT)-like permease
MMGATVLLWGFNFTVTKYVLTHGFKPLAYSTIRYGGAAVLFGALTLRREGSFSVGRRSIPLLLAAAAVGIFLNQLGYMYAVKLTTATTVALILGTTPIFAAILASAAGLERLSTTFWIAGLISFGGVALVAAGSGGGLSGNLGGDILGVATAATWAAYSVFVAPLMRDYSPFRISAIVLFLGWIPLAAVGSHQVVTQDYAALPALAWVCLAYALLGPLVITNVLWFTAIDRVGPSRATLFANMQPFVGALVALLVLSEPITWLQVLGGVGIAVGIALPRIWRRRPAVVAEPA